jgi:hypothetical protein
MLRTAETYTLGAKADCGQSVTWDVSVGADAELPLLVGPLHELGKNPTLGIGFDQIALALNDPPR